MARVRQVRARRTVRRQGRSVPTHTRGLRQFRWRSTAATCAARTHCRSCLAACVRAASLSAARLGARCRRAARTAWPRRCGRRSICYAHCNGARGAASALRLGYLDAGRRRVGVLCTSAAMPRSNPIRHDTTGNECRERTMFQYTLLVPLRRIRMLQISTVAAEMCENAELSLDSRGRPTSGAV
jgi:hypothetical protein